MSSTQNQQSKKSNLDDEYGIPLSPVVSSPEPPPLKDEEAYFEYWDAPSPSDYDMDALFIAPSTVKSNNVHAINQPNNEKDPGPGNFQVYQPFPDRPAPSPPQSYLPLAPQPLASYSPRPPPPSSPPAGPAPPEDEYGVPQSQPQASYSPPATQLDDQYGVPSSPVVDTTEPQPTAYKQTTFQPKPSYIPPPPPPSYASADQYTSGSSPEAETVALEQDKSSYSGPSTISYSGPSTISYSGPDKRHAAPGFQQLAAVPDIWQMFNSSWGQRVRRRVGR